MKQVPKLFDIEIRPLTEQDLIEAARVHMVCFPEKIESLLGPACIIDTFRERILGPSPDTFGLVAIHKPDSRLAGFVYGAQTGLRGRAAHRFTTSVTLRRHMLRRGWWHPGVWRYVLRRLWGKLLRSGANEGYTLPLPPDSSVVKMLGVDPPFRFSNIGFDLMAAFEGEAVRRGARRAFALVDRANSRAERLYVSIGWARTSPRARDYAVFAMHKALTSNPKPVIGES